MSLPLEETLDVKGFALLLSSRIGKTGLPEKYHTAIRLMEKFGGYQNTNDNAKYKRREITKTRALQIKQAITQQPRRAA